MNKYEVVPGLWVGSEISDIDAETKFLIAQYLQGDTAVMSRIRLLQERKRQLLAPKKLRKR
jgi:hypothetical protein